MSEHVVKIIEATYINHDVKRFLVEKPNGFTYIPGQATDVSINLPQWKNELRPFTFTSLVEWPMLEFTIKIYNDHDGVTKQLGKTNAGAELILHDVFGTIQYRGPGVFIAGGAGITPFIAILRTLHKMENLSGNLLINSNKTVDDIILAQELQQMLGDNFINVLTREGVIGFMERRIDKNLLIDLIHDFSRYFYVCGTEKFVQDITGILLSLGVSAESLVVEK
ncbi:MAG: flavodoxin reductase [Sphingobacteriales bacterium]|nr:flavodoxin reductase [Sphingobacteriales bacterium]MBI3717002.1 flavodoxin reductase [Sphingobacteriales bacterium]